MNREEAFMLLDSEGWDDETSGVDILTERGCDAGDALMFVREYLDGIEPDDRWSGNLE